MNRDDGEKKGNVCNKKRGKEEKNDSFEIANQRLATDLFCVICIVFVSVTVSSIMLQ